MLFFKRSWVPISSNTDAQKVHKLQNRLYFSQKGTCFYCKNLACLPYIFNTTSKHVSCNLTFQNNKHLKLTLSFKQVLILKVFCYQSFAFAEGQNIWQFSRMSAKFLIQKWFELGNFQNNPCIWFTNLRPIF